LANNFVFLTIKLSYFLKHVSIKLRGEKFWAPSPVWRVQLRDKIIFYSVQLTLFAVFSMETRNVSSVFIQILMTHTLDLVTGSSLKRWFQRDNLPQSQVAQATNASRAKTARLIMGRKSRVAGERRVKNMPRGQKYAKR